MNAIYKKEIRNYFKTPLGYIFIAALFALTAIFFVFGVISNYQNATINMIFNNVLGSSNIICLFLVPILTMQLFSEERNKKTDQLLITSPISVWDIVLGKYFAALAVFLLAVLATFIFPFILYIIGKPNFITMFGSYLGFVLMWACFISIGVFISSLTESQVISAIMTLVVLFVLYILDGLTGSITQVWLRTAVSWLSVLKRNADFSVGLINIPDILYYISFVFTFLFLTQRNIEKRRYS